VINLKVMELGDGQRFVFKLVKSKRVKADTFCRYLFASDFVADKIVLDAACGSGFGTFFLAQEAKEVTGIDVFGEAVSYAEKNYHRDNVKFIENDLVKIDLKEKYYDVIVSFHTLEQLNKPNLLVEKFYRALKNDGIIIISTPNKKIVAPFGIKTAGKFHQHEFYKRELIRMFGDKFQIKWFGQRTTNKFFSSLPFRIALKILERLLDRNFGFYGRRESSLVEPLKLWQEPKEFIILLKKNHADK